eukprot:SAG31_NODE_1113_length_9854_cov_2.770682_9_plen_160_part_00
MGILLQSAALFPGFSLPRRGPQIRISRRRGASRARESEMATALLLQMIAPAAHVASSAGSLHFRSAPDSAGPDLALVEAVLARSWTGVLQRDLFGMGGSVKLNSSDCTPHCNKTCASLPPGWVQVSPNSEHYSELSCHLPDLVIYQLHLIIHQIYYYYA